MNVEDLARDLYDTYCQSVGGVAFNGDTLPSATEFFADPAKEKQASAWRMVASKATILLVAPIVKHEEPHAI